MPDPGTALIVGGTVGGAVLGADASKDASKAQSNASAAAIAEQQRQFNLMRQDLAPYRTTGQGALNQLAQLYGLPYMEVGAQGGGYGANGMDPFGGMVGGTPGSGNPLGSLPFGGGLIGGALGSAFGGKKDPIYQWDAGMGQVKVDGKKGEKYAGFINPATGEITVYNNGRPDAALSAKATDWLRTGNNSIDTSPGGMFSRFVAAADNMRQRGWKYTPPGPGGKPADGITRPSGPNMAGFFTSPDYNFRRTEGIRGIEQGAAARGGALSGNALRAVTGYSSDLASTEFGNYFERLSRLAGLGGSATNTAVSAGQNYASNIGQGLLAQGAARASGIMGQANSIGGAINSGINNYLLYKGGFFGGGGK